MTRPSRRERPLTGWNASVNASVVSTAGRTVWECTFASCALSRKPASYFFSLHVRKSCKRAKVSLAAQSSAVEQIFQVHETLAGTPWATVKNSAAAGLGPSRYS